ncbi:MAG TPA: hypothetical protein VKY44_04490 [Flavobacterium sp.]|nr:hypothetical protein [Flavobacterium sp.]
MRKLFLSAIACVAFAGSAFASSEVNEQVEKFEVTNSNTSCEDQWSIDMDVLMGKYPGSEMDLSYEEAKTVADALLEECLNDNNGGGAHDSVGINP